MARALGHCRALGFEARPYQDGHEYGFAERDGAELHLSLRPGLDNNLIRFGSAL